mgnify:CR=1 FL=1
MNRLNIFIISLCVASFAAADGDSLRVKITPSIDTVVVKHADKSITIMRHQDPNKKVNPIYAKTSRDCPPFCIQPMVLAPGVETIGELEVLDYLRRIGDGDDSVIVIDSRTEDWVANGTIPGAVNIPWTTLSPSAGADPFEVAEILELRFGAISQEGLWNYANAKTLVLFCNGMWCGQSPTNIKTLVNFGYPPHKLKWYRGGMQNWEVLGLTVAH